MQQKILLIEQSLVGNWLKEIDGKYTIWIVKPNKSGLNIFEKLFFKINRLVLGESKLLNNNIEEKDYNYIQESELKNYLDNEIKIIINLTSLKLNTTAGNIHNIYINKEQISLKQIILNTINIQDSVPIQINFESKIYSYKIRYDQFSISKNIDLTIHTILTILEEYLIKVKIENKEINLKYIKLSFKAIFDYLYQFFIKVFYYLFYNDQWIIAYNRDNKLEIDSSNLKTIVPPKDRFWADPIVVNHSNKNYVFIEELIYKRNIAHLSVFELKEDGTYTQPQIILEKPYHLSYPFIFKEGNKFYMIPETSKANNIQLYEAEEFPYKWKFVKKMIDNIKASDVTLFKHDQKWWMFASIKKYVYASYDDNLSIFYAEDLLNSEWKPHKNNPVKTDVSCSRPAGPLFVKDHIMYRVSQNAEKRYGYGYNLSKIVNLTVNEYKEEIVENFIPGNSKFIRGIHTYNYINSLKVYDILTKTKKY